MPTPEGSAITTAQGVSLPKPAEPPLAPVLDRSAVDHWQRRLDRARATMHLHQQEA